MRDDWKRIIKNEMMKEASRIMEKINADPTLKDVEAPEEIYDQVFAQIREYEEQRVFEQLSEKDKELIRLGKVYKRRRKWNRCFILVAAVVVVLAVGTVCIGEDENIFSFMSRIFNEGEEIVVDSENIEPIVYIEESEAYEEINEEYGFTPVELKYLPAGITFYEATFSADMQSVNIIYEINNETSIIYVIRPNYREASFGTIVEDEKIQEFQMVVNNNVTVTISEYRVEKTDENKWAARFEYQDVQYMLRITNMQQEEVEKIIENLYFIEY